VSGVCLSVRRRRRQHHCVVSFERRRLPIATTAAANHRHQHHHRYSVVHDFPSTTTINHTYKRVGRHERYGISIVGNITPGIPAPRVPTMNGELLTALIGPAIVISFVG
jgi:hypothetical protein